MARKRLYANAGEERRARRKRARERDKAGRHPVEATAAHLAALDARRLTIVDRQAAEVRKSEQHAADERTKTYREEKAAWLARRETPLAEAKAQYERQLAQIAETRKGGRPKTRALSIHRDPADALVTALRPWDCT